MRNGSLSQSSGKRSMLDRAVSRVAAAFRGRSSSAGPERRQGLMESLEERRMMYADTGYHWAQPGGAGSQITLTYSYSNLTDGWMGGGLTASQLRSTIEEALSTWSSVAPINFVEVADSGPTASDSSYAESGTPNIRFGYHSIDGSNGTLAHTLLSAPSNGLNGDVHFDGSEAWTIGPSSGHYDLLEVATHEIGHALGLDHSSVTPSMMNATYGGVYGGANTAYLTADDISGIQSIYGSGFGYVLSTDGRVTVRGTDSADNIQFGTSGSNVTITKGATTFTVAASAVTARGGGGDDTLSASSLTIPVKFYGGAGNNSLYGGAGSDTLEGGVGNDYFVPGFGSNVINGGGGGDAIEYSNLSSGWHVETTISGATYYVGEYDPSNVNMFYDTVTDVTGIVGTSGNDVLLVTSSVTTGYYINALGGNDNIRGGGGNDYILPGFGSNTIQGNGGSDIIDYSNLSSGWHVETTISGATYYVGEYDPSNVNMFYDTVTGVTGIIGTSGNDALLVTSAITTGYRLTGGDGNDNIRGGGGNDVLSGGFGSNTIQGNGGSDVLSYAFLPSNWHVDAQIKSGTYYPGLYDPSNVNMFFDTVTGIVNVTGGAGNDVLDAHLMTTGVVLHGGAGNDTLTGGSGNDTLYGEGGTDVLNGNGGTNSLIQ